MIALTILVLHDLLVGHMIPTVSIQLWTSPVHL